jgi:hypothetical protein
MNSTITYQIWIGLGGLNMTYGQFESAVKEIEPKKRPEMTAQEQSLADAVYTGFKLLHVT